RSPAGSDHPGPGPSPRQRPPNPYLYRARESRPRLRRDGRVVICRCHRRGRVRKQGLMLTAVILVKSTREGLTTLGPRLADVEGISEVYTVTGEWDFVAIARVREHDDLAQVVTQRLTKLDGIERTQTMVAFQQFSAHDLEAMFGLAPEHRK